MTKVTPKPTRHPRPAKKGDASKPRGDAPVTSLLEPEASADAVRSEGQRLLTAIRESTAQVGARAGTSKNTVSCWRTGTKRPSEAARAKLHEVYGISPTAWDRAAGAPVPPVALPTPPSLPGKATIDLVNELVTRWMKVSSDPQIPLSMQAKVSDGPLAKYLQIKSRLEREAEFLEDKIVLEHPSYRRIVKAMVAALKPYPDAMRAVRDAIGSLEG